MKRLMLNALVLFGLLAGCASGPAQRSSAEADDSFGVLVMAHGGGATWNREVESTLAPLRQDYPMEIAFGMADAASLEEGVRRLEAQGVRRIAVVRLFVSGESWYDRTRQILGLMPGAPPKAAEPAAGHAEHAGHAGHGMGFWRIETPSSFALSREGLMDAPEIEPVLAQRAIALSRDPTREDVLVLAHGPEDDAENRRWLAAIDARADAVRKARSFRHVRVETLREDWPDKREAAQARIRGFVEHAVRDGGRAIVIPFRVQGFGPYTKVLEGLDYASSGEGLVPDVRVREWVDRQARQFEASTDWLRPTATATD